MRNMTNHKGCKNWKHKIGHLNLPQHFIEYIDSLLSQGLETLCRSALLTGSWASNTADDSSDFDLLIVVTDSIKKKSVTDILKTYASKKKGWRPRIDIKVLTEEELLKAWRGRNHLVVYTSFRKGIALVGSDLSSKYPLQPDYLRNVMFETLKEVHEASLFLEDNIRFEYACVVLVNSLKSLLFLEKLLDRRTESRTMAEGLSAVFGGIYGRIIQIYFDSAHRCRRDFGFGGNVTFSSRNDQRYSRMMYQELLTSCESIRTYAERMYRESSKNLLF